MSLRPVGQAVKTPPSHGGDKGSIPLRVTKARNRISIRKVDIYAVFLLFRTIHTTAKNSGK